MAELRAWEPTARERIGNWFENALRSRGVAQPVNALAAAHLGAYFTPAAPVAAAADLYSIGQDLGERFSNAMDRWGSSKFDDAEEMNRDKFYASKRKATKSKEDLLADELRMLQGSDRYKGAGKNQRARLEQEARRRAEDRYSAQSSSAVDDERQIEADWNAYLGDIKRRRDEYYSKGWQERHPALADTAALAAYAVPAWLAKRGFGKLAKEGEDILSKVAGSSGQARADAMLQLEKWRNSLPKEYGKVVAKAALIPAEIRTAGEVYDATFLPEGKAREHAREGLRQTFTDPEQFAADMGPSLLTGATSTAFGSLLGGRPPLTAADAALDINGRIKMRDNLARLRQPPPANPLNPQGPLPVGPGTAPQGIAQAPQPPNAQSPTGRSVGYAGQQRQIAQQTWDEALDAVPVGQRATYIPDTQQIVNDIERRIVAAGGQPSNSIPRRVDATVDRYNTIQKSGGDPYSPAGRAGMLNRPETLAVGGLAFEQALSRMRQALVDLDGDGRPDAIATDDLGLGDQYNPYEVY